MHLQLFYLSCQRRIFLRECDIDILQYEYKINLVNDQYRKKQIEKNFGLLFLKFINKQYCFSYILLSNSQRARK